MSIDTKRARLSVLRTDDTGTVLMETAILAPLLLMLGFAGAEIGLYFYQSHLATTGVRDAARYMARSASSQLGSESASLTIAQNIAIYGSSSVGAVPRVPNWPASGVQFQKQLPVSGTTSNYNLHTISNCVQNNEVFTWVASAEISYSGLGFLKSFGLPVPDKIRAKHAERCIGQ